MAALKLDILTPERQVLSTEVDSVSAPGVLGSFGVRPKHAPLLSSLNAGTAAYIKDGQKHELKLGPGFAEVSASGVRILVESAETHD